MYPITVNLHPKEGKMYLQNALKTMKMSSSITLCLSDYAAGCNR